MPDHAEKLDDWSSVAGTTDVDGVVWPTHEALDTAGKFLLPGWDMVPSSDGGIVFTKRMPEIRRRYEIEIDESGIPELLVFQDGRLFVRISEGEFDDA